MDAGSRSLLIVVLAALAALVVALRRRAAPTPAGTWHPLSP